MLTRAAETEDSQTIWEIRTSQPVRAVSGNERPFDFQEHDVWYRNQYFTSGSDSYCFVLETEQNKVIGYCRYDFNTAHQCIVVSIALDSDHQGKGFGNQLLSESLAMLTPTAPIRAVVQKKNTSSTKLFLRNDFVPYDKDDSNLYFTHSP